MFSIDHKSSNTIEIHLIKSFNQEYRFQHQSRIHKDCPFSSDEEFDVAFEEFLSESDNENDEIGFFDMKEEMTLVGIIDDYSGKDTNMKTNQENVEIVVETNNDLQNDVQTIEKREHSSIPRSEIKV